MSTMTSGGSLLPRPWHPILDGALAERAHAAIAAVTEALLATPVAGTNPLIASGEAGRAIYHYYVARAQGTATDVAMQHLERAIDQVAELPLGPHLFTGFSGVAFAIEHLVGAEDDLNDGIDEALQGFFERTPWREPYELIMGTSGLGVYLLERGARPSAAGLVERLVERLAESSEAQPAGRTWFTPADLVPLLETRTVGQYNLGLAHGIPGAIAFLAHAVRAGRAVGPARALLAEAVPWLRGQRRAHSTGSLYPAWIEVGNEAPPGRQAWCYGDPGVAAALAYAAFALDDAAVRDEAIALLGRAAGQSPREALVLDVGLCHGSAGLAHVCNRLYQATSAEELAEAARRWFAYTLDLWQPGQGVGGFSSYDPLEKSYRAEANLLEGASGVALALLGAVSPVEPGWDRVLLLSGPAPTLPSAAQSTA